jgi:hypothetical protein
VAALGLPEPGMDPWLPAPSSMLAALEPVSCHGLHRLRTALRGATSSLDMYRSAAVVVLINETSPIRFGAFGDTLLLGARGFLGLPDGSFCLLEPQGQLSSAEQGALLDMVSSSPERIWFACISQRFIDRHPVLVSRLAVEETPELAEYVYRLDEQAALAGTEHGSRRRQADRFERDARPELVPIAEEDLERCRQLSETWLAVKRDTVEDADRRALREDTAAVRFCLSNFHALDLFGWLVVAGDEPVGYMICERITDAVVAWRVGKSLRKGHGAVAWMEREIARRLLALGFEYWNWDIDGGVAGVREHKRRARPCRVERAFRMGPA